MGSVLLGCGLSWELGQCDLACAQRGEVAGEPSPACLRGQRAEPLGRRLRWGAADKAAKLAQAGPAWGLFV
jgi:hypothetical protein